MTIAPAWQPLLTGDDAAVARAIADDIARALAPEADCWRAAGAELTDGLPGGALLFAQLGRTQEARALLDMAVARSEHISGDAALFGGITGLGWSLRHLAHVARPADLAAVDAIETALAASLAGRAQAAEFDLMSGLTGLGVFALAGRRTQEGGALHAVLRWLVETAEPVPIANGTRSATGARSADTATDARTWRTRPSSLHASSRAAFPTGCHFPGVAHGTAGVVGLLASAIARGAQGHELRETLGRAISWLLACEQPGGQGCFLHQCPPGTQDALQGSQAKRAPARSAWCTGGPGIALMITRAGIAANDFAWRDAGHALARATLLRPAGESGVRDACLCHGSAGLMLVYGHMFALTEDVAFRMEAIRWFRRTLAMRTPGDGVAGFAAMNVPQQRREAAPGLLFGAAGVGLALLAACSREPPRWGEVLLLS